MKISKFILTVLLTISLFALSTNKASAFFNEKDQSEHRSNDNNRGKDDDNKEGGGGACLPINGQAWFLLIVGLAIGTKVLTGKKVLKLQKVSIHI